ncbi:hypothetical protein [Nocardia sp. NBC_00511]|uniref:hypothetical protein n=1 Tax=Nocardia sp. NBC_00511 TaxID=2903591 RepID=UPI0030DE7337
MAEKVEVQVAGMRTTATGLEGVSTRIDTILAAVSAASDSHTGCWGDDEFGRPFAEGDSGYTNRDGALQGVLKARAARLREYATGLRDGATTLETTEANNTDSFES